MTASEFYSKVSKTAKQCNFPNKEAEERATRDVIYRGMNSQCVRDKCINSYNNGEEISVEFLLKHLEVEDSNFHHKTLSPWESTQQVNYMCYDQRQSRNNKQSQEKKNGKPVGQKTQEESRIQNSNNSSRIPPEMEGLCLKCGKHKHQPGQQCSACRQKCKLCGKLGHFARVCMSKKHNKHKMVGNIQVPKEDDQTFVDEIGRTQSNSQYQWINMLKLITTLEKYRDGVQTQIPEKNLKFKIGLDPQKTLDDHIIMRVDKGADINCINENTFHSLFPKVKLEQCQYILQNFGNLIADIQILGKFQAFLLFKGVKYLNTLNTQSAGCTMGCHTLPHIFGCIPTTGVYNHFIYPHFI